MQEENGNIMDNRLLELRGLTRKYRLRTAVDNVDLVLERGKTCALLGPNGSGKTTLMKTITGLVKPTSGEILLEGKPLTWRSREKIAYMPTENYFYSYMTIRDAKNFYRDFYADFSTDRFEQMLSRMELDEKASIRQLSSGMSAKLRLALALAREAELIMLDEPLNGVDILTRYQVIQEIRQRRENSRTMLLSTHLVEELDEVIDMAIYMHNGCVERVVSREELNGESYTGIYLKIYGEREVQHAETAEG